MLQFSSFTIVVDLYKSDSNLDPCGLAVMMVVETILVLVDGAVAGRIQLLQLAPCPCP